MGEVENGLRGFGSIFYKRTVVGNNTYSIYTKMGGRTSLFLTSQRMPSRYGGACDFMLFIKFVSVGNVAHDIL